MSRKGEGSGKLSTHKKGAWTVEEDAKLSQFIELYGPNRWRTIAIKSGLNRCGKSCRLRWLNYLRPDITRGNITRDEVNLIHRLHKLLGNKWAWIAGRIPGRTDNEIKNYWNSHLSKKTKKKKLHVTTSRKDDKVPTNSKTVVLEEEYCVQCKIGLGDTCISFDANPAAPEKKGAKCDIGDTSTSFDAKAVAEEECAKWDIGDTPINSFDVDEFFHFSEEGTFGLDWVKTFLELDDNDLTLSNYSKEF